MAPNDPSSLPRNIHSENPSCFDTSSLMLDQSKGKNRAWSPTVALASGRFHQKLSECLHPGSGAGCCISLFCSGFWVPPAPCCTSRPCAACSAPLPCCWAGQRHPRTPVWAPCLPGLALPIPWCDTSLRCSRLPAPAVRAAGCRWPPSPLTPGRKPTVGLRCPPHLFGTAQRMPSPPCTLQGSPPRLWPYPELGDGGTRMCLGEGDAAVAACP